MVGTAIPRRDGPTKLTLAGIGLLKALATAIVLFAGFRAVSDDDFARVVIAQQFAAKASFDPSGTSWLPFPFWLTGGVMKLAGPTVTVARALSVLLSLGSAMLLYLSALWCGLERKSAWLGAAIGCMLPHAVWLGAATIPDGYTAALSVFALASLCRRDATARWLGALAIGGACLSRYESWPLAVVLAGYGGYDAFAHKKPALALPALAALLGPCLWLVHGSAQHGDAFFFVKRVAAYRESLARSPADVLDDFLGYPKVLLRAEPELMLASLLALLPGSGKRPLQFNRLLFGAACLFGFLIVGALRGGAPTHHPERPLLVVWLVLCLVAGHAIVELWRRRRAWLGGAALVALSLFLTRPFFTRRDSFIDRSAELEMGERSREIAKHGKVLIDTHDYGYFAIMAGFRDVERTEALATHDPRAPELDLWSSRRELLARLDAARARWLIAPKEKLARVPGIGRSAMMSDRYELRLLDKRGSAGIKRSAE